MNNDKTTAPDSEEAMLRRMNDTTKRNADLMQRLGLVADGRQLLGPAPKTDE